MFRAIVTIALVLLSGFVATDAIDASEGSTFVVTRTQDTQDGSCDSDCSLREAIDAANSSPGEDHVVLPEGYYLLNLGGGLTIFNHEDVAITGAGADRTTIDGDLRGAVIRAPGADLEVRDLTIRRGGMGGIWAGSGSTVVERVALTENNSGAGGGIAVEYGSLTVRDSTIARNEALFGGGVDVYFALSVEIVNTTVSSNMATTFGGGIYSAGGTGNYRLINSTVAGNAAPKDSFGGVSFFKMINSIVFDNTAGGLPADCAAVESLGHNMDGDGSCGLTGAGDQPSTDPLLGPLADNGEPTETHALLPGSPAIDAADATWCPEFDQRGAPRPNGPQCDIGAYEAGDYDADLDDDGFSNLTDNCPAVANPDQADSDQDGFGDVCDSVSGDTDCDADADSVDALAVLRSVAGLDVSAQCLAATGDVNCSGVRDAVDALVILRYVAALPVSLPTGCPPVGPP